MPFTLILWNRPAFLVPGVGERMMHRQTILAGVAGVVLALSVFLVSQAETPVAPAQPAAVASATSAQISKKLTDPSGQPFEDLQGISQRFADELGRFKEKDQAVSPVKLAEQADAEPNYPMSPTAAPAEKFDAETIYKRAKPGVVILGGVFKCNKCNHWHVRCASGFVIRHDGLIVTNLHAIEPLKTMERWAS